MLKTLSDLFVPKAYAACDPSAGSLNLGDCFFLDRDGTLVSDVYDKPAVLVNIFIRNAFIVAGLFIFLMVLYAGFKYIEDTSKGKDQAREILSNCLVGFAILFMAYWVVQLVEIILGLDLGI